MDIINEDSSFETQCVHSGIKEYEFGPVVPPIYQTSTFKFKSAGHGAALFAGEEKGYIYTRMGNPTVEAMEDSVALLEGGHKALGCASGMAAVHTVFTALTQTGDHVVCSRAVYGPTITLLNSVMKRYGVATTYVDASNCDEVRRAITEKTRVIFIETPGNPTLAVADIAALAGIAHQNGALLVVDNTFMSPALQKPLGFGADIVLHSMTKFLNGHADVVGGVIVVKDEPTYREFRTVLNQIGGVIDPFNSFLVHRGIKTLALRMERHCESAMKIAEYLDNHPAVEKVMFPGLPGHPQYELARRQQKGPGGLISIELRGGYRAGENMMNHVRLFQLAVSLGGVESLIQHPASMTHASMGQAARAEAGICEGLVRLSVGIEHARDLIVDLERGLAAVNEMIEVGTN
jgi:methionine-gamma-lyase